MGLQWVGFHQCIKPKFIVKLVDDAVVDFHHLKEFLEARLSGIDANATTHYLAGFLFQHSLAHRDESSKWFVTRQEFQDDYYPDYLTGLFYITVPFTARHLVKAAREEKSNVYWIDDVWITGMLREKLHIRISESLNNLLTLDPNGMKRCLENMIQKQYRCPYIVGLNGGDTTLITRFATAIEDKCYTTPHQPDHDSCVYPGV